MIRFPRMRVFVRMPLVLLIFLVIIWLPLYAVIVVGWIYYWLIYGIVLLVRSIRKRVR